MPSSKSEEESAKDGWNPTAPTGAPVTTEERSLDIAGSDPVGPGGYFNQQGTNEPRVDLDDNEILPPTRNAQGE